jgi:hypothetical protein
MHSVKEVQIRFLAPDRSIFMWRIFTAHLQQIDVPVGGLFSASLLSVFDTNVEIEDGLLGCLDS